MNIKIIHDAKDATGIAVIIDVFRAFTVEPYLINNGVEKLIPNIENGYTREEAIACAAQEMNIDANEMLTYMQHYLLTKGKVKVSTTGSVQWEYR